MISSPFMVSINYLEFSSDIKNRQRDKNKATASLMLEGYRCFFTVDVLDFRLQDKEDSVVSTPARDKMIRNKVLLIMKRLNNLIICIIAWVFYFHHDLHVY